MRSLTQRLAFLTCLACSSMTEAAVMHFPTQDIPIPTTFAGVSIDLENATSSNALAGLSGGDVNFYLGGAILSNDADETAPSPNWQPIRSGTGNTDPIVSLGLGTIVDGTSVVSTGFGSSGGASSHFPPFVNGASSYIGFQLVLEDATVANGWARVTLQNDNTPGIVHEWAFESTGAAIAVGQIPEPSHTALSLLGLAALAMRRRRRWNGQSPRH